MGEVYRARDTQLDRDVAIKVLPEELARDRERQQRFEREAKLLAGLNHVNVATVHGFEVHSGTAILVMELVEGEDLSERLQRGPLDVESARRLFAQIAEGLEAAHRSGVVHRDLKPSNVKIGPGDRVKVLDFGLARSLAEDANPPTDLSLSPTLTAGTEAGVLLGTAAYMSPEQAKGQPVDKRTDVWSFGATLFEALSGRMPFEGASTTELLAALMRDEPPWEALPDDLPRSVRRLLRRCLAKDPDQRLRDLGDARLELADPVTDDEPGSIPGPIPHQRPQWVSGLLVIAPLMAAALIWLALRSMQETRSIDRSNGPAEAVQFIEPLPASPLIAPVRSQLGRNVAVSPLNDRWVYSRLTNVLGSAQEQADQRLLMRQISTPGLTPYRGCQLTSLQPRRALSRHGVRRQHPPAGTGIG